MNAKRLGRHLLDEEIGKGAFGRVFRATAEPSGETNEVEILNPELASDDALVAAIKQNAAQTSKIRNDGVVVLWEVVVDQGQVGLVLEPAGGVSLRALLKDGPLEAHTTAGILRAMLGVLAQTHASGALHLAIQPENVYVLGDGTVRISEWGMGKAIRAAWRGRSTPRPGDNRYMAPEQARGIAAPAADLYSAGVLAWEMLSGQEFFPSEEEIAVFCSASGLPEIRERVRVDCPPWLSTFVETLTRSDPTRRPRGAEAAIRAMDSARGTRVPVTGRPPVGARRGPHGVPEGGDAPTEATLDAPEALVADTPGPVVEIEEEPSKPLSDSPPEQGPAVRATLDFLLTKVHGTDDDIEAPSSPLAKAGMLRPSDAIAAEAGPAPAAPDTMAPLEQQAFASSPAPESAPAEGAAFDADFDALTIKTPVLEAPPRVADVRADEVEQTLYGTTPAAGSGALKWILVTLAVLALVVVVGWLLMRSPRSGPVPASVHFETPADAPAAAGLETEPPRAAPTAPVEAQAGAVPAPRAPGAPPAAATTAAAAPPAGRAASVPAGGVAQAGPPYPIGTYFAPSGSASGPAPASGASTSTTAAPVRAASDQPWGPISEGGASSTAVAADGTLSIKSSPSGATVVANGKTIGTTPLYGAALPSGRYEIKILKDGYHEAGRLVDLAPGEAIDLATIPLQYTGAASAPAAGSGTAVITAPGSAAGSKVFVDGTLMGTLPVTVQLAQGSHLFKVQGPDGAYFTVRKDATFDGSGSPVTLVLAPR
jgi:hypothetical protein